MDFNNEYMRIIMMIAFVLNFYMAKAQTAGEWFNQKEKQIACLIEQIGALKVCNKVITKGYLIAGAGLTEIFRSKDSDYIQHNNYFLSLLKVRPAINGYSKVAAIYKMKADIESQYRLISSSLTGYPFDKQKSYIHSVYSNLVSGCYDLADELAMVRSEGQLRLKDNERILRIDHIYREMQDRYEFSCWFLNQIRALVSSQEEEKNELNKIFDLYGLK